MKDEDLIEHARQLETIARRLKANVQPGHVDYIKKVDAGRWIDRLVTDLYDLMRPTCP